MAILGRTFLAASCASNGRKFSHLKSLHHFLRSPCTAFPSPRRRGCSHVALVLPQATPHCGSRAVPPRSLDAARKTTTKFALTTEVGQLSTEPRRRRPPQRWRRRPLEEPESNGDIWWMAAAAAATAHYALIPILLLSPASPSQCAHSITSSFLPSFLPLTERGRHKTLTRKGAAAAGTSAAFVPRLASGRRVQQRGSSWARYSLRVRPRPLPPSKSPLEGKPCTGAGQPL